MIALTLINQTKTPTAVMITKYNPSLKKTEDVNMFVLKVIALLFMPAEHKRPVFEQLFFQIADRLDLLGLLSYVEDTWVTSTILPIPSWSVYNKTIRTNDREGWHIRMNVDRELVYCSTLIFSITLFTE